jgi:hypothetical protein
LMAEAPVRGKVTALVREQERVPATPAMVTARTFRIPR